MAINYYLMKTLRLLIIFILSLFIMTSCATISPVVGSDGYLTSETGLQYKDLVVGDGDVAEEKDRVAVHYTGLLVDGTKFDSSLDKGLPFEFKVGAGQVIKGWDEGIAGMKEGGKRLLRIPPELAYGSSGAGDVIPPDATLLFEVELVEVY